ncbi:MAG TPA: galactokinase [Thermoanaerobaculia bacterium]|nr:galactokinase [Thermoanaerobaculia bacterium]
MSEPSRRPAFKEQFGRPPEVRADAPGRVNLIGEHTDYNGGFVLPSVIPQRTRVELARRDDRQVCALSVTLRKNPFGEYRLGEERKVRGWLDYIQGVTEVLRLGGYTLSGFDLRIDSDIPSGSGLSSSAALEVALLRALRQAFDLEINDVQIALAGQRAENDFVGAPVGVMDQMAASLADEKSALFLDTRSLRYERVVLPSTIELVVINSGVSHSIATGEYRVRRQECERAAELLGVKQLRELDIQDLWRLPNLPEPLNRRARHVVTENARVRGAVAAIREGDLPRLGKLLVASHESLRDDYEVSVPEVDLLVDLARAEPDVYGARITGGGFGGSIVAVAQAGTGRAVGEKVVKAYGEKSGQIGTLLVPARPAEAA